MPMKSKALIPFLIAGVFCTILLFGGGVAITQIPAEQLSPKNYGRLDAGKMTNTKTQDWSIPQKIISLISLAPLSGKTSTPIIASMIENHEDARPHQKGIRDAVLVFEMIVEGDISRFLALFRSDRLPKHIGPVRSLRPHFISVLRGYGPLLLHAGGSSLAYEMINSTDEIINHDGIRYDGETYQRDSSATAPHNLFMDRDPLKTVFSKVESLLYDVSIPFYETTNLKPKGEKAQSVELNFGGPLHNVTYTYRNWEKTYERSTFNAKSQAEPANIFVLEAQIDGYNQPGHIPWTKTFGDGKAILFRRGVKVDATWQREKTDAFKFFDAEGKPIELSPGQIWVTILPSLSQVGWE